MQVWCDWQLTLCDPYLSALEVRFHDDALYKSMFTFTLPYLLSRKSDDSARGAMITLTIQLNSTQLPVELS